jgi:bleomycin hydrolase
MRNLKYIFTAVILWSVIIPTAFAQEKKEAEEYLFTNKIFLEATSIKNQQKTGTCWSYCTTSFIESELLRMGKPSIDLSEMYNVRMNYVEKSTNYVLRQGKAQFSEGGLSHDVLNSISKYGLVPESAFSGNEYNPGNHNHQEMVTILESTLNAVLKNTRNLSNVWMGNINGTLNTYLGKAPTEFEYEGKSYTPQSFVEFLEFNPNDYTTFTSFTNVPFYEKYILQVPDNWANGSFNNVPLNELMQIIDNALENGFTIAWDADVSEKTWSRKKSIAIMPATPFQDMSKEERADLFKKIVPEMTPSQEERQKLFLNFKTTDDHLMHIIGTAIDQNNNAYYLVKNSWGDKRAFDGYVYVSKAYMAMKTMGIMIHKDAVPKTIAKKLK